MQSSRARTVDTLLGYVRLQPGCLKQIDSTYNILIDEILVRNNSH